MKNWLSICPYGGIYDARTRVQAHAYWTDTALVSIFKTVPILLRYKFNVFYSLISPLIYIVSGFI